MLVEICCGSYEDGINAYKAGAKRIELNSALFLGGLTPSLASLKLLKKETDLTIICMVRPRGGGFHYTDKEVIQMFNEAKDLLDNGADGIAFGFLNEDFSIDLDKTKKMVELIHSYNKKAVFHRAFDLCINYNQAIKTLIDLKIDRVLTSGTKNTVMEGKEVIKELVAKYGNDIEILAGCGVNKDNAKDLVIETKVNQIHSSCKTNIEDCTTSNNTVSYAYNGSDTYEVVSKELVEGLLKVFQ
ncbi:MAG: copper homeostasis protein CutC [Thomasclavelia sp.]|nr:copper homeostasis protein CutC [Thomasclavelia sp.]